MTAYDFPPTAGELTDGSFTYTAPTGIVYEWNGYSWTVSVVEPNKYVKKAGDTMTGALNVPANATGSEAPRVDEVVRIGGDVMTGSLYLKGDPVSSLEAATKSYVDNNSGGGGGGGNTVINYNGASAWADWNRVNNSLTGMNVSSVVREDVGKYRFNFTTPMPSSNYAVTATADFDANVNCTVVDALANSVAIWTYDSSGLLVDAVQAISMICFATNALPPKGGTGTDAWGAYNYGLGVLTSSFNCSAVKNKVGDFTVTFNTPMPTADYSVTTGIASETNVAIRVTNKTANGFQVQTGNNGETFSNYVDVNVDFQVNATNATLPDTVTQEQIEAAINNPGASAWGVVSDTGVLEDGLNVASTSRSSLGTYEVTFSTPMPNANYSATIGGASSLIGVINKTATGFTVVTFKDLTTKDDRAFSFAVFSTNALPPTGGTGTDAWFVAPGALNNVAITPLSSFNIASITRSGAGQYNVLFTTPMPTDNYSAIAGINEPGALGNNYSIRVRNRNQNGFTVQAFEGDGPSAVGVDPNQFSVVVNATNATLPATLTQDMLVMKAGDTMTGDLTVPNITVPGTGVIDAMQTPKAIVQFRVDNSGAVTINTKYNIASVVYTGNPGHLTITFTNPIPGTPVISASASSGLVNTTGAAFVYTITGNGNAWTIGTLVATSNGTLGPETSQYYYLVWYGF